MHNISNLELCPMAALTPEICFRTNPVATDFHAIAEFKAATQHPKELHPVVAVSLFQGEGQITF